MEDRRTSRRVDDLPSSLLHLPSTEYRLSHTTSSSSSSRRAKLRQQQSNSSSSRKRQRSVGFPLIPSGSTSNANDNKIPSDLTTSSSTTQQHDALQHPDQPDWTHLGYLLAALLLTTGLAVVSAFDAKWQCLQHETYALRDLVDDDSVQADSQDSALFNHMCWSIFQKFVLPTAVGTAVAGSVALLLVYLVQRDPADPLQDDYFENMSRWLSAMLVLLTLILGLHTYNVAAIMLIPRALQDETDNPYQSLAAVDRYGHVGDNANLYYLTWVSEGLSIALVYQVGTALVRAKRRSVRGHKKTKDKQLLLPTTSSWVFSSGNWQYMASHPQEALKRLTSNKKSWYNSLYRLRIRTGIWTAALLACLVIVASSQYVGSQVLWPVAKKLGYGSDKSLSSYLSVCRVIRQGQLSYSNNKTLPPQLCHRTVAAWLSGVVAAALCATAIGMHLTARYCSKHAKDHDSNDNENNHDDDHHDFFESSLNHSWRTANTAWDRVVLHHPRLPLRTELLLSILLSVLLGFNAVFCTGNQGPAATVGNLYYASWLAFLLCVRVALGCTEELCHLEERQEDVSQDYQAPPAAASVSSQEKAPTPKVELTKSTSRIEKADSTEKARLGHVRGYFFLGIFSVICASSAYDAASNQNRLLSHPQLYMMLAPSVVAFQSLVLFLLCLSKSCYGLVSSFCVGGFCSIFAFTLWLANLILTMHSEDSWAVNGIGEIEMANLYYFSWASIITAGLQMTTYVKRLLGIHHMTDFMSVVWLAIVKVCFVILGAGLHIWHTISDNCGFDEITHGAVTFCSRTVLAMIVALTGMAVGGLIVVVRLVILAFPPLQCKQCQAHVEMLISLFLVLLFGAAVAMITGIGGPGQSVGDLYYSTWLSFWIALGVFCNCYSELNNSTEQQQQPQVVAEAYSSPKREVRNSVFV